MPKISKAEARRKAKDRAQRSGRSVETELSAIEVEFTVTDFGSSDSGSYGGSSDSSSYGSSSDSGSYGSSDSGSSY